MSTLDPGPEMTRRAMIPDGVWHDLTHPENAAYDPKEVIRWSGEEIFEKYCEWHGLLGSWHKVLWRVVGELRRIPDLDKMTT